MTINTEHRKAFPVSHSLCCDFELNINRTPETRILTLLIRSSFNSTSEASEQSREAAMAKLCAVISCLLLSGGAVTAQTAQTQTERLLPQWLTGIIAVVGFLFLTFVGFLVKKAWCEESSRRKTTVESVGENEVVMTNGNTYETSVDMVRSKEDLNAYDNLVIDATEDKVTAM